MACHVLRQSHFLRLHARTHPLLGHWWVLPSRTFFALNYAMYQVLVLLVLDTFQQAMMMDTLYIVLVVGSAPLGPSVPWLISTLICQLL